MKLQKPPARPSRAMAPTNPAASNRTSCPPMKQFKCTHLRQALTPPLNGDPFPLNAPRAAGGQSTAAWGGVTTIQHTSRSRCVWLVARNVPYARGQRFSSTGAAFANASLSKLDKRWAPRTTRWTKRQMAALLEVMRFSRAPLLPYPLANGYGKQTLYAAQTTQRTSELR